MLIAGIVLVAIILIAVAAVVGASLGARNSPNPVAGKVDTGEDCKAAGARWEQRRTELCAARRQVADAEFRVSDTTRALAIAAAVALALGIAAAFAPWPVNAFLWAAFAVAALISVGIGAALANEEASRNAAVKIQNDAAGRQDAARLEVVAACPIEEANGRLSVPGPC